MLIRFIICALLISGCGGDANCPDGWVPFMKTCYLFGHELVHFTEAEQYCRQHNAHLVHINSEIENTFLKDHMRSLKPILWWMGLTDEAIEGVWKWFDTDDVATFTDWSPGQPASNEGDEDCVTFWIWHDFKWDDTPCTRNLAPLCEMREKVCGESEIIG